VTQLRLPWSCSRMPGAAELVNTLGTDLPSLADRRWDA
jgi:hypothetical protein